MQAIVEHYRDKEYALEGFARESLVELMDGDSSLSRDPMARQVLTRVFGPGAFPTCRFHASLPTLCVPAVLSLHHCWALWLWARCLEQLRSPLGRPLLVHFDAHDDLSSSGLVIGADGEGLAAPTGDLNVDLRSPDTVARGIQRGFIGIGSFITPLLHTIPSCEIVHVVRSEGTPPSISRFSLVPTRNVVPGRPNPLMRPGMARTSFSDALPYSYTLTNDIGYLSELAPQGAVMLDIDLDYFCNAYDDRAESARPVPSQAGIHEARGELVRMQESLRRDALWGSTACVSVAVSPGFFPSQYLPDLLPGLIDALEQIPARAAH